MPIWWQHVDPSRQNCWQLVSQRLCQGEGTRKPAEVKDVFASALSAAA